VINLIRMRPRVYREAKAIEDESKREEVKTKGENQRGIFVDKTNADLLGGTESALGLEDKEEDLRAHKERGM